MAHLRDQVQLKSVDEVLDKLSEMIHRYRRRYLRSYLRPCPANCKLARLTGNRVVGCKGCMSHNPQRCTREELYQPVNSKEELSEEFRALLRDREVLQRDYPAIAVFLWVLGELDKDYLKQDVISEVE